MKSDALKWNQRYATGDYPSNPHQAVTTCSSLASVGRALDIAAGNGRNTHFLAEKGYAVDAVDISETGLACIKKDTGTIRIIHADLDRYQIAENQYELIININFLQRRLFPYIVTGLKKNGLLIFQTFMDPRLTGATYDPEKRDQYLMPNELLHAFLSLRVLQYEEKELRFTNGEWMMAALLVARKT